MSKNPSVLQLGPLPPPYGGISTHVKSLKQKLDEDGFKNTVIASYQKIKFLMNFWKYKIIHSHDISPRMRIFLPVFKLFGKRVILSLHGESLEDQLVGNKFSNLEFKKRRRLHKAIKKYDYFIVSNRRIRDVLLDNDIHEGRILVTPEFIPTDDLISKEWSEEVAQITEFIGNRNVILTCGDMRKFDGSYLYGYDLIFEFCREYTFLENEYCFVINLINNTQKKEIKKLKQEIKDFGLEQFVFVNDKPLSSLQPLVRKSAVFVRATNTDGNSVSVLEALSCKVPVLASDVVDRPSSCVLFKNRDSQDFNDKLLYVIKNQITVSSKIHEVFNSYERIKKVYQLLMN